MPMEKTSRNFLSGGLLPHQQSNVTKAIKYAVAHIITDTEKRLIIRIAKNSLLT